MYSERCDIASTCRIVEGEKDNPCSSVKSRVRSTGVVEGFVSRIIPPQGSRKSESRAIRSPIGFSERSEVSRERGHFIRSRIQLPYDGVCPCPLYKGCRRCPTVPEDMRTELVC